MDLARETMMRLLSYNIHKGIGGRDRRYRLDRVCRVIEQAHADLCCLQEVTQHARRSRGDDQPRILAELFNACDHFFKINVHYRSGGYGNLFLSRWPILHRHDISLRLKTRKPRAAQVVVVDTPEGPLHLANWHLALRGRERRWQAERLLLHPRFRDNGHLPTLIVGDSNDWRDRLAARPFAEHGFEQATDASARFRTFPALMPLMALDKAFHCGGIVVREAHVIRTPLARLASDHLPLLIEFNLVGGPVPPLGESEPDTAPT